MTIETIPVKITAIGVYAGEELKTHLKGWSGKPASELIADDSPYFKEFVEAPVPKLVKVGIIKGIKGSQYGGTLESSLRDRLAYDDLYDEDEEATIEKLVELFNSKNLPPGSAIFFNWPSPDEVQVTVSPDQSTPASFELKVLNKNVTRYLLHWFMGECPTSESTQKAVAEAVAKLVA